MDGSAPDGPSGKEDARRPGPPGLRLGGSTTAWRSGGGSALGAFAAATPMLRDRPEERLRSKRPASRPGPCRRRRTSLARHRGVEAPHQAEERAASRRNLQVRGLLLLRFAHRAGEDRRRELPARGGDLGRVPLHDVVAVHARKARPRESRRVRGEGKAEHGRRCRGGDADVTRLQLRVGTGDVGRGHPEPGDASIGRSPGSPASGRVPAAGYGSPARSLKTRYGSPGSGPRWIWEVVT